MSLAEPLSLSAGAWRAIGAEVVEPATAEAPDLAAAWAQGTDRAGTVTVFLTPQDAGALVRLLDGRPELAAALQ